MDTDILIIGGGPGGSICALALAESGLRVTLVDRARFPRDKVCGDAISGKVLSVLHYMAPEILAELHLQPMLQPTHGIRFVAPSGAMLDIPLRHQADASLPPPAYVSTRLDFDAFLWRKAASQPGIETKEGCKVSHIRRLPNGFQVDSNHGSLSARFIIGADGAQSVVARHLAGHKVIPAHHSAGVRLYCQGVTGFHPETYLELHYLQSLLPGYFWMFPLPDGKVNVGLGMLTQDLQRTRLNLREALLHTIDHHPAIAPRFRNAIKLESVKGFGLPLGSLRREISGDGYLLIGDAAGLVDPFTGEGIGNAMISGRIAARFAQAALTEGSDIHLRAYDEAVFKKIGAELQLSHKLQRLARHRWLFNWVVGRVARNPALQRLFTTMFDDLDIRKQLRQPGFYWKLLRGT